MSNSLKQVFLLFIFVVVPLYGQQTGKSLQPEDLAQWERITDQVISNDGKWVAAKMAPWRGDATVFLYNQKGEQVTSYKPVDKIAFSHSSQYMVATLPASLQEKDSLKLKKTKEDDMPKDRLLIYHVQGKEEIVDSIKSYKLGEITDWIAYQRGGKKDSTLIVRSLDGGKQRSFPAVSDYNFAKKANTLYYVSKGDTLGNQAGVYRYEPETDTKTMIHTGKGVYKQVKFNDKGDRLAFLYCTEKDSTNHDFALFIAQGNETARLAVEKTNSALPAGRVINENGNLRFSDDSKQLFFGVSPRPKEKDTTILADYRPNVQVWTWNEGIQYTQQNYNKKEDLKKTYTAVYHWDENRVVPLANESLPIIQLANTGNPEVALAMTTIPYDVQRMWRGKDQRDIYLINTRNGHTDLIKEGTFARASLSPQGKYAYWYNIEDSCWYTYSTEKKQEFRLTTPASFIAWDEDNDVPDYPNPYGTAGWTENDQYILLYDRYDIWKFHPEGKSAPVNLTVNGRNQQISYRYLELDREAKWIDTDKTLLLRGFNEMNKSNGYYSARFNSSSAPKVLLAGDFNVRIPRKAKNSDAVIYTVETFRQYPDLQLSDLSFKKSVRLTEGYKQQEGINWGTVELVKWTSLDGKPLEGMLFKPDNFDPNKKYPMIVNFYERYSETLNNYRMPEPHRSTIDYHLYLSNGYIIFNPDVVYDEGYPGESCYNCVMPGIAALVSKGFIDEKSIGAQGHSWGGYQVAYLATRTNLFAAIESGAPVVNMFSAYGGIRWGSGLNRSFQYEHGQSRIGGTPWTTPLRYIENSPLFTMDKVETPILIMHNDADGHVPWYQGIEYFVALRRLQKPAWMLNYPGEPHWPLKIANQIDFQKRMFQFFEHYLHNKPMPQWMSEGLPAIEQDFELAY